MKYVIPLGAFVLLGIVAALHPVRAGTAGTESPASPAPLPAALSSSEAGRWDAAPEPTPIKPSATPAAKPVEPTSAVRKADVAPWRKIQGTLDRDLSLTPLQQGAVEQILRERTEEIRTCHEEIRKAKLLDMRHYEWQVGKMKETWFRRIDALLDSAQHQRFVALAEQGIFNDGLGINEEPGMTVLD